jgi:4-amino-4-deoxy-L-arabinose transferase-like glycosyltransferase
VPSLAKEEIKSSTFLEGVVKAELAEIEEKADSTSAEDRRSSLTVLACRIVCVAFALLETWSQRHFINEDGISYLDMSDGLIRHNWHLLVNPIWSPLYPFLIGLVTWFTRPTPRWEVAIAHILNFVIFLGALASFEFLLRQVIGIFRQDADRGDSYSAMQVPLWAWQLLGYSLFAWTAFGMMWAPRMVTPDLCVAMCIYLDAGLLLQLRTRSSLWRTCFLLGLTLGLGYLGKAILFPMAFVFIAVAFVAIGAWKKAILPLAVTFLVFCAISAPLVIGMSERLGKPSYSEAGNLNYAWHVNHVGGGKLAGGPFFPAEAGPPADLEHPAILLYRHPEVYEIEEPLVLTYAPRSDMGYWGEGTKVVFSPRNQIETIIEGLVLLFRDPHILPLSALIVAGFLIILLRFMSHRRVKSVPIIWSLLVPGIIGPCLYLLISVEPRYVAPFFLLILLGLLPAVALGGSSKTHAQRTIWPVAVATGLMIASGALVAYHAAGFPRAENGEIFLEVGSALNHAGVQPGEEIGIIGDGSDGCRWARLARVRIVAQVLREDVPAFWKINHPDGVYEAFRRAGAKAVVAEQAPSPDRLSDWQQLGNSHYYVHFLAQPSQN